MKPIRIGVVGCGDFGERHVRTVAALPEYELVALADRNTERATHLGRELGALACEDLPSMLAATPVDAVVIATPPAAHNDDIRVCLERSIPCLTEKPLVDTRAGWFELSQLSDAEKRLVCPAHISRFLPSFAQLQTELGDERVMTIRATRIVPRARLDLHGEVHPALSAMVHDLDLVRALIQSPLAAVHSEQEWVDVSRPFPQRVTATLEFAGGETAIVQNHWTQSHERQYIDATLDVETATQRAKMSLPGRALTLNREDGLHVPEIDLDGAVAGVPTGALATQLRHFAAYVSGARSHFDVPFDDALWSVDAALTIAEQMPAR